MMVAAPVLSEGQLRDLGRRLWQPGGTRASYPGGSASTAIATPASLAAPVGRPRSSATVSQVPEEVVNRLADLYSFRGHIEVARFLRQHPSLVSPLLEAPKVASRYFGRVPLALEVFRDPEAHGHRQLFALIETGLDGDAALEALERFDEEWWLDALPRTDYRLAFTLEYPDR